VGPSVTDTDPEAEHVQLELLRRSSPERRLLLALSLTDTVLHLSRRGIRMAMPDASEQDVGLRFVELHYGPHLAGEVRESIRARR
jgi:hypothetical protein